jgi:hypothetical protein
MRALFLLAGLSLFATGAQAATRDAFAQACMARAKASEQSCICQARLARATFSAPEHAAMIRAMQGDQAGFKLALAKMGERGQQAFVGKMQALKVKSERECR